MKSTVKKMKRQARDWEKIFGNHIFDKVLVSRRYKRILKTQLRNKQYHTHTHTHTHTKLGKKFASMLCQRIYISCN